MSKSAVFENFNKQFFFVRFVIIIRLINHIMINTFNPKNIENCVKKVPFLSKSAGQKVPQKVPFSNVPIVKKYIPHDKDCIIIKNQ